MQAKEKIEAKSSWVLNLVLFINDRMRAMVLLESISHTIDTERTAKTKINNLMRCRSVVYFDNPNFVKKKKIVYDLCCVKKLIFLLLGYSSYFLSTHFM